LFDDSGEPFVADFGIAQIISGPDRQEDKSSLTGTPAYMSPEQIRGEKLTGQSDIYSLGIMLYELLGEKPYKADTTFGVLMKHLNEPPPTIEGIPPDLQVSLDRALAKNPSYRYDTAAEFISELGSALKDKAIEGFLIRRIKNASQMQLKEKDHIPIVKPANDEGPLRRFLNALRKEQKLGRYEIKSLLQSKDLETHYLAYDPSFDREVMIRVMQWDTDEFQRKFLQMKQIAKLEHPAIVPIYEVGSIDDLIYTIERKMTGGSLAKQLKQKLFSINDVAKVLNRIALGLNEAHRRGIVHRNLSPKNILFDDSNDAYIASFGLARVLDFTMFTTAGSVSGTPAYMSPEQSRGEKEDSRSDLYSLGIILFEMLSGRKPFKADTTFGMLMKQINEPPPNILEINPNLPPLILNFLEKAIAKDPGLRYSSILEMAAIINAIDKRISNY
jgi:serine/threonine protein kinase